MDMHAIIKQIKDAGANNVRIVDKNDNCAIEVYSYGQWKQVISGIKHSMAEDIVSQSTGKLLLG